MLFCSDVIIMLSVLITGIPVMLLVCESTPDGIPGVCGGIEGDLSWYLKYIKGNCIYCKINVRFLCIQYCRNFEDTSSLQ